GHLGKRAQGHRLGQLLCERLASGRFRPLGRRQGRLRQALEKILHLLKGTEPQAPEDVRQGLQHFFRRGKGAAGQQLAHRLRQGAGRGPLRQEGQRRLCKVQAVGGLRRAGDHHMGKQEGGQLRGGKGQGGSADEFSPFKK